MSKKSFHVMLEYLFGDIENIEIQKMFSSYSSEPYKEIITEHLFKEEENLRTIFSDYDLETINYIRVENITSGIKAGMKIYKELDESILYNQLLSDKILIGKILYHRHLKESRKYKITNILRDLELDNNENI